MRRGFSLDLVQYQHWSLKRCCSPANSHFRRSSALGFFGIIPLKFSSKSHNSIKFGLDECVSAMNKMVSKNADLNGLYAPQMTYSFQDRSIEFFLSARSIWRLWLKYGPRPTNFWAKNYSFIRTEIRWVFRFKVEFGRHETIKYCSWFILHVCWKDLLISNSVNQTDWYSANQLCYRYNVQTR